MKLVLVGCSERTASMPMLIVFIVLLVSTIARSVTALTAITSSAGTKWTVSLMITLIMTRCTGIRINEDGDDVVRQQQQQQQQIPDSVGLFLLSHAAAALRSSHGHPSTANIDRMAASPPISSISRMPTDPMTEQAQVLTQDEWSGRRVPREISMPFLVTGYGEICDISSNNSYNYDDVDEQAFPCTLPFMVHPQPTSQYPLSQYFNICIP